MIGGAGDDTITWNFDQSASYYSTFVLDGGTGFNELILAGTLTSNMSFDLSNPTNEIVSGVNNARCWISKLSI